MTKDFDAYHKWLGIPPKDQPPNHYRLLALDLFESDPEIIDSAANRQMSYLQQLATGQHAALSQKLLNEIAAARLCLLNRKTKAEYDRNLSSTLAAQAPPQAPPAANEAFEFLASTEDTATTRRKSAARRGKAPGGAKSSTAAKRWLILGGAGIFSLLLAALIWAVMSGRNQAVTESAAALRLHAITPNPKVVEAGKVLNVPVWVDNADTWKGKVHYGFRGELPAGAQIDPQTGTFTWTPKLDQLGKYAVVISVETGDGLLSDATSLGIKVTPVLEIVPVRPRPVEAGKPLKLPVTVKNADAWQGQVRFALGPHCPEGAAIDAKTGEFSWTPPPDQAAGNYDVTVSAQGPEGQAAQAMFSVTVAEAAPAPLPEPVADNSKPEKEPDAKPENPPGPTAAERQWISAAQKAAKECKGVLVQHLPLTDGAARVPPESLGRLAAQKKLYLGVGKFDGDGGQTWDFGQGFEQAAGDAKREVPSLAKTTGHARVDVSLESRPDGLYLALRGRSQSGLAADTEFTRKAEVLSKAMETIRGWYTAEPGPEKMEVIKTLRQNDVTVHIPPFGPLPAPPPTSPVNPRTGARTPSRPLSGLQAVAAQQYEFAKAARRSQVDGLLNTIQKRLETFKKRAETVHKRPDPQREAADQVLATTCKSISAVVYPAIVTIEGKHLYQVGDWRLYWSSDRNYVHVWYREGSLAVELNGGVGGSWLWRDEDQEYLVRATGKTSVRRFVLRPWEEPGSATVIYNFSEFSAGRARLGCDGEQISIVLDDGGTLSIPLASPEVLFKTARNGNSLKFSSGSLALPVGADR
jgi:hypothetical protein